MYIYTYILSNFDFGKSYRGVEGGGGGAFVRGGVYLIIWLKGGGGVYSMGRLIKVEGRLIEALRYII